MEEIPISLQTFKKDIEKVIGKDGSKLFTMSAKVSECLFHVVSAQLRVILMRNVGSLNCWRVYAAPPSTASVRVDTRMNTVCAFLIPNK